MIVVVFLVVVVLVDKVVVVEFEARGQHRMVVRPTSAKIARIEPPRLDALCSHDMYRTLSLITYSTYVQ
jgi:hypothetical protein